MPHFEYELNCGYKIVAGLDEAGRGPLCGPVVAGAVIIKPEYWTETWGNEFINDSKQLSEKKRAKAYDFLLNEKEKNHIYIGVGIVSASEIDKLNILQASLYAMECAVKNSGIIPEYCLVDGNKMPKLTGIAIVKGDSKSKSIASASIIAKETRDSIMRKLSDEYPEYNWIKNKGYPTKEHLEKIQKYGVNELYRKTYAPVANILNLHKN